MTMSFQFIVFTVGITCSLINDCNSKEIQKHIDRIPDNVRPNLDVGLIRGNKTAVSVSKGNHRIWKLGLNHGVLNNFKNIILNVEEVQKNIAHESKIKIENSRKPRSAVEAKGDGDGYLDGYNPKQREQPRTSYVAESNIDVVNTDLKPELKRPSKTTRTQPDIPCKLLPYNTSISSFRHNVYYYNLNLVYMHIVPAGDFDIKEARGVVGGTTWVWTFFGKAGALEFLNWPIEFEIWSMGLLTPFIRGPFDVPLYQAERKCDQLIVGNVQSDKIISEALVELPKELMNMSEGSKEKYGPSFFCYKRRMFLNPEFFYVLCKHMVCPVEAIKYQCCSYYFDVANLKRRIDCRGQTHEFDSLWWIWPTVVAVILFAFVPLLLMNIASNLSGRYHKREQTLSLRNFAVINEPHERTIFLDDHFPVTLCNTIFSPIEKCCFQRFSQSSRVIRFFLPFLTLVLILLQILLDRYYLNGFVLASIKAGVPLGFRSIAAGFNDSKKNFMPLFGGPYIALGVYVFITCIAVTIPSSLSEFLVRGLQERSNASEVKSSLMFDLYTVERLGSVHVLQRKGYHRIYNTYLGQFYMLLNLKFWKKVSSILTKRWMNFATSKCHYVLLPIYLLTCIVEVFLCVGINGLPIISFAITIIRAYSFFNIFGFRFRSMRVCHKLIAVIVSVVLVVAVLFFLYMFCTIFMDATLFVTRFLIFTYTGIVIYPKLSYGYLIFSFTVFYYLWDCVKNYSMFYWRVLKSIVSACEHIQKITGDIILTVDNERHVKGVEESIFEHVIETNCPRRKQVFVSLLKLFIILGIIGVSLGLLTKTDKIQELHVVMHVGTALFTCALPMVLKSMCRGPEKSYRNKQFEYDIKRSVREFLERDSAENETDSE